MALVVYENEEGYSYSIPAIPPVSELLPKTRQWRKVKPCGTGAAYRRHLRRLRDVPPGERYRQIDEACLAWHRQHV